MAQIDDKFKLLEECPSLSNSCILFRNPHILDVAWFIYSLSSVLGKHPIFDELGITCLDDYLRLVDGRTNFRAIRAYQLIEENLLCN